jgi:phosphoribosylformylglycinamidine cyclo-ligase
VSVKGLAHITGGGITENIPRVLPDGLDAEIDTSTWQQGAVFDFLQEQGNIETREMRRTFNCGIGMVAVVNAEDADRAIAILDENGESAWRIGQIVTGKQEVAYV